MSPRPYTLGRRQDQVEATRAQTLEGARAILRDVTDLRAFTIDAVARQADVARGTVYYQFGSKTGLLEALCDHLAQLGGLEQLTDAFTAPDPRDALHALFNAFAQFWQADRLVMRRLRAFATLDADIGAVITARDARRSQAIAVLIARLAPDYDPAAQSQIVRVLQVLTSFETFDALADAGQDLHEVVPPLLALADTAVTTQAWA